jgi:hypothetical protein
MPDPRLFLIINRTQGRPQGIPFMKHLIEKSSDNIMRFFTPELYLRFNSADDEIADLANEEWEKALQAYQHHLDSIRERMPSQVRNLAELCLHDAEVLGLQKEQPVFPLAEPFFPGPFWSVVAIVTLRQEQTIWTLIYLLWDRVREYPAREDWPFSRLRKHWLYDEVDVARDFRGGFLHRILFSDGSIVEMPFVTAITNRAMLPEAESSRLIE